MPELKPSKIPRANISMTSTSSLLQTYSMKVVWQIQLLQLTQVRDTVVTLLVNQWDVLSISTHVQQPATLQILTFLLSSIRFLRSLMQWQASSWLWLQGIHQDPWMMYQLVVPIPNQLLVVLLSMVRHLKQQISQVKKTHLFNRFHLRICPTAALMTLKISQISLI